MTLGELRVKLTEIPADYLKHASALLEGVTTKRDGRANSPRLRGMWHRMTPTGASGSMPTQSERARRLAISRSDARTGYQYADWSRSECLGSCCRFHAPPGQTRPAHPDLETGRAGPCHGRRHAGQPCHHRAKSCAEPPRSRECQRSSTANRSCPMFSDRRDW
jgi:hypothetical protein